MKEKIRTAIFILALLAAVGFIGGAETTAAGESIAAPISVAFISIGVAMLVCCGGDPS